MKSTPAMRARIYELMGSEIDDYDRAVKCVLEDVEALEAALREIMGVIKYEEWDIAPRQAFRIALTALAPEQDE